ARGDWAVWSAPCLDEPHGRSPRSSESPDFHAPRDTAGGYLLGTCRRPEAGQRPPCGAGLATRQERGAGPAASPVTARDGAAPAQLPSPMRAPDGSIRGPSRSAQRASVTAV